MSTLRKQQALEAWTSYCESLKVAGQQLLRSDFPVDELDLSEGLRYLSRLLFTSIERCVEGADPVRPLLYAMCTERIKVGGDNPDNRYFAAPINSRYRYVLRGDFRKCNYFSIVTTGGVGSSKGVISRSIGGDSLISGNDGYTEIFISREPYGTNHVLIDDSASLLIVRCTIEEGSDRDIAIKISRVDEILGLQEMTLESVSRALQESAKFVTNVSAFFADWTAQFQSSVNRLPLYPDQPYLISIGGDPNILYYWSAWELGAGECLVIHIPRLPKASTWNCQLCNVWLESLDYTIAQIHLNSRTATIDGDGGLTMFIADEDPGHRNWLRTLGHHHGAICFRLVGAAEPFAAETRVASVIEVRSQLSRTLSVTPHRTE